MYLNIDHHYVASVNRCEPFILVNNLPLPMLIDLITLSSIQFTIYNWALLFNI